MQRKKNNNNNNKRLRVTTYRYLISVGTCTYLGSRILPVYCDVLLIRYCTYLAVLARLIQDTTYNIQHTTHNIQRRLNQLIFYLFSKLRLYTYLTLYTEKRVEPPPRLPYPRLRTKRLYIYCLHVAEQTRHRPSLRANSAVGSYRTGRIYVM